MAHWLPMLPMFTKPEQEIVENVASDWWVWLWSEMSDKHFVFVWVMVLWAHSTKWVENKKREGHREGRNGRVCYSLMAVFITMLPFSLIAICNFAVWFHTYDGYKGI